MSTSKHTQREITLPPELTAPRASPTKRPALEVEPWGRDAAGAKQEVISDLDAALSDVDARFDEMLSGDGPVPSQAPRSHDLAQMRELFAQIAAGYMRPVRDFVIELNWGEASRAWIDIVRPSLQSLRGSCEPIGIDGLAPAIDVLDAAVADGCPPGSATIFGEPRQRILDAYAKLVEILPQTFRLDHAKNARETIIVHSLLTQVPDVGKVTIDKLYAAGLSSLEALFVARVDELSVAAGIETHLAERIVRRFRWYRSEVESAAPSDSHAAERQRLASLATELEALNLEFARVADGGPDASRAKIELRKARNAIASEMNVLLARIGEVGLVKELERLPFERKVTMLRERLAVMDSQTP